MIDLKGKHVFIAGGSRGIGRATALMCASAGADVSVNFLKDSKSAEAVVRQINGMGRRSVAVQADIAKDGDSDRAVAQAVDKLGPVFGLVVSAGIFEASPIDLMDAEFWDRTMAINLRSTFLVTRSVVRSMQQDHATGGSIVLITSTAGQRGSSVYSAYATSKGAQLIFMRSMAKELAPRRIRVNCVAPGWTETDMSRDAMTREGRAGIIESIPLGRIGKPEDPAAACCFLLSELAQFITGSTITVDGGFDMRG